MTTQLKLCIIDFTAAAPQLPQRIYMSSKYSTKNISTNLIKQILESVQSVKGWGSVEIYIQNNEITQITEKSILKPGAEEEMQNTVFSKTV